LKKKKGCREEGEELGKEPQRMRTLKILTRGNFRPGISLPLESTQNYPKGKEREKKDRHRLFKEESPVGEKGESSPSKGTGLIYLPNVLSMAKRGRPARVSSCVGTRERRERKGNSVWWGRAN